MIYNYLCQVCRFLFVLSLLGLVSCSSYQKTLKSNNTGLKVKMAESFFNKKDYKRAVTLYDQVYSKYIGKPQGERVLYMYGISAYNPTGNGDYYVSAEIFNTFLEYYPNSEKAPQALFIEGKSHYKVSPNYERDQKETIKARDLLQQYVNDYSGGKDFQEANKIIKELTNKLEKKSFEIAKQYGTIEDHKACIRSLELFLLNYPGSIYSEDAYYYMLKSSYVIATNSVVYKEEERLKDVMTIYNLIIKKYPKTHYRKETDKIHESIKKHLEKYGNNKITTS